MILCRHAPTMSGSQARNASPGTWASHGTLLQHLSHVQDTGRGQSDRLELAVGPARAHIPPRSSQEAVGGAVLEAVSFLEKQILGFWGPRGPVGTARGGRGRGAGPHTRRRTATSASDRTCLRGCKARARGLSAAALPRNAKRAKVALVRHGTASKRGDLARAVGGATHRRTWSPPRRSRS
jgi:hypothetical protein